MDYRMTRALAAALLVLLAAGVARAQGYSPHGACPANEWNAGYGSMTTSADCSQPAAGNISGLAGVVLGTQTASSSANLQFTGIGASYNTLKLVCNGIRPAASGAVVELVVGTGTTPTYQTANYYWSAVAADNATPGGATNGGGGDPALGTGVALNNGASYLAGIEFTIHGPADAGYKPIKFAELGINTGGAPVYSDGGGVWGGGSAAITALQFQMSAGNIAAGRCTLYGMNH